MLQNPRAHSSLMEYSRPNNSAFEMTSREPHGQPRNSRDPGIQQLQVHSLLSLPRSSSSASRRHDADSDSLTDSGKGPSEEGDGQQRAPLPSDSTDDSSGPQPPLLPPRRQQQQQQQSRDTTGSWPRNMTVAVTATPSATANGSRSQCVRSPQYGGTVAAPVALPSHKTVHFDPSTEYVPYAPATSHYSSPHRAYRTHDEHVVSDEEDDDGSDESSTSGSFVIDHQSELGQYTDIIV